MRLIAAFAAQLRCCLRFQLSGLRVGPLARADGRLTNDSVPNEERFFARGALRMTPSSLTSGKTTLRKRTYIAIAPALLGFAAGGGAQTAPGVTSRIIAPVDEGVRTTLAGNTHPLARPQFDQGAAPPDLPMERMLLVLKRSAEQETALQALLDQQHDKSSANYHRWLTPDEFGQQFGPADQDVQTVTSWLASHGLQVARASRGRTVIEFSGTAAQVREAFRAEIHNYLAGGAAHWANASDPQIPTALAPVISGVASLHNFPIKPLLHVAGAFSKAMSSGIVKPISGSGPRFTFNDPSCGPVSCYAVGPYDFATIYNVLPLWNGTGTAGRVINGANQNIAIVGESNINLSDVEQFRSMFGLLPANNVQVIVDGPDPGVTQNDLETEALLDVEWAGAVAPGANIKFIASASTNTADGVDLSALYAVDNNVAPVLSVSFGLCELFLGTTGTSSIAHSGNRLRHRELQCLSRVATAVRLDATASMD
jgi:Pro-kumamolisin, activation domain